MRTITTRADLFGPSAGVSYSLPNAPQSSTTGNQPGQQSIQVVQLFKNAGGSITANPLAWLLGFVLFMVGWKLIEERTKGEEFAEVKIGISNWFKIGFMILLFFAMSRFLATKYNVPGLSSFVVYATGG